MLEYEYGLHDTHQTRVHTFSILITPQGVDAFLVSQYLIVNGVKYGYDFRAIKLTNMLILLVFSG